MQGYNVMLTSLLTATLTSLLTVWVTSTDLIQTATQLQPRVLPCRKLVTGLCWLEAWLAHSTLNCLIVCLPAVRLGGAEDSPGHRSLDEELRLGRLHFASLGASTPPLGSSHTSRTSQSHVVLWFL